MNLFFLAQISLLTFVSTMSLSAAEAVGPDPDLPQPFDLRSAEALVSSPPFTRSLNLSDSLVLTGIAYIEGKAVATILNKEKKESYVVSETPNAQGWRLAETSAAVQLNKTQAKIMIGNEMVTVRYAADQLAPPAKNQAKPGQGDNNNRERGDRDRDRDRDRNRGPGPDSETRNRIGALSETARGQLFEEMRKNGDRLRNASPEERTAFFKTVLDKAEKQDKK